MNKSVYHVIATKRYKKDVKRLKKSIVDLRPLENVLAILKSGDSLPYEYRDHPLQGNFRGTRECHIGPDWLLVYKKNEKQLILVLVRTGDHRHVLGIE